MYSNPMESVCPGIAISGNSNPRLVTNENIQSRNNYQQNGIVTTHTSHFYHHADIDSHTCDAAVTSTTQPASSCS